MAKKIGMISLGCCKNQVDAEIMLAKLAENRAREHAQNLIKMMYNRKAMRKEAGMGMREGKEDAGPL
jgi:riboflavin synthase